MALCSQPSWPRLALPRQSLYYFAMSLPGAAVGAFFSFADPGPSVPYDTARRIFGIDLATDQQAAGLLMWVIVSVIYLLLITASVFRWASREEAADAETSRGRRASVAATPARGDWGATSEVRPDDAAFMLSAAKHLALQRIHPRRLSPVARGLRTTLVQGCGQRDM